MWPRSERQAAGRRCLYKSEKSFLLTFLTVLAKQFVVTQHVSGQYKNA